MRKHILILSICHFLLLNSVAFANSPTSASFPLPTLQKTKNIDTVTTEKVQAAIVKTPSLKGQAVTGASHAGTVTLQGSVNNPAQERDAINAAKSVHGVKYVKSQLNIKKIDSPQASRSSQ